MRFFPAGLKMLVAFWQTLRRINGQGMDDGTGRNVDKGEEERE